ncbi:phage protein NinX family protein [Pseudomonas sp. KT_2_4]|uniref:phage protein NinX family protein n=1 Tax=Pseudomonas sp. KT_2_4 TaxID=3241600 RepID=UPI00352AF826
MNEFVEVKTQDLSGAALDWAVAKAAGVEADYLCPFIIDENNQPVVVLNKAKWLEDEEPMAIWSPSTDWAQGGPLIEKYKLDIGAPMENKSGPWNAATEWGHPNGYKGETPLIAACRAIVSSALGDTVSVPKELLS